MFTKELYQAALPHARALGIEPAALLAVIEVESAGVTGATVKGRTEPVIRWEGHYFDRRLSGNDRQRARAEGLAHPNAGAIKNPKSQEARWAMLTRAAEINSVAAFESASYGIGQVMGAHWQWLGYPSVASLVNTARSGIAGQIELMVRYIDKAGLTGALKRQDWAAFARGYNGAAFAKHGYHTKLAAAYARYSQIVRSGDVDADRPSAAGMLRLGSQGARVRELQHLLVRAGQPLKIDGDFGMATHNAVRAFQQSAGIEVDGVAGPETMAALEAYRHGPADRPGELPMSEVPEVKTAGKSAVAVGLLTSVRDQVAEAGTALIGFETETAQMVANCLLAGAGVVGAGLAVWALVGVFRSKQTVEQPT